MTDDRAPRRAARRVADLVRGATLDVARRPIGAVSHHVRVATRIAPGRPALWIGLRMVAAMALPIALSRWFPPVIATSASLAGYFTTLIDKGGAYRTRAIMMALGSAGALAGVSVGMLVAGTPFGGPVVVIGFTLCALVHLWGPNAASAANPAAVLLAVATFAGTPATSAANAALGTAIGSAWAMLLALILWPVRVHKPGRRAIANVLGGLAQFASELANLVLLQRDRATLLARHRQLREQLEAARRTLVASRRGRGEHVRDERLLALAHVTDTIFGRLVGLEETLDALGGGGESRRAARLLLATADTLDDLAYSILDEKRAPDRVSVRDVAGAEPWADARLAVLNRRLVEQLTAAAHLIGSVADTNRPSPEIAMPIEQAERGHLRDMLDLDSPVIRHALRVAIASTIAVTIAAAIDLAYAHWMLLTTYLLLLPYRSATLTRTVQRAFGTVIGALVAAGLVQVVHDHMLLVAITIAFAAIGASVLQLNFGLFSLFVTPTFVLIAELQTEDFTLFGVRIAYTMIGGMIAVFASALLWPARERVLFDDLLAGALDAAADYVAAVQHAVATRSAMPEPEISRRRRLLGVELANAELAIDRMIAERAAADLVEPRMEAIAFTRRLGGTINVLGTMRLLAPVDTRRPLVADHVAGIETQLRELAGASREHRAPGDAPPATAATSEANVAGSWLARSTLQLDALREALQRMREVRA